MDYHKYGMEVALDAALEFQGQEVILKKNEDKYQLIATPVSFNPKMTDQKITLIGQKQSFLFRASDITIEIIAGLLILYNGFHWEVIRGQGHFYYNDPYQLGIVIQCLQGKPIS
jgi:hypothetical protein